MLLKTLVKVLGKEFGLAEVTKEAVGQYEVEKVRVLAKDSMMYHITPWSARIAAASVVFGWDFTRAKDWVEANFSDSGNGDPI